MDGQVIGSSAQRNYGTTGTSGLTIPESLRAQVLETTHTGHQGETKCLLLARQLVFWPGITSNIRQMVKNCELCNKHQAAQLKLQPCNPIYPEDRGKSLDWISSDIFQFNGSKYLIIIDYYSSFPIIRQLNGMSAATISNHFTSVLAQYGLPSMITVDFGSQYVSEKFKKKCEQSGITFTYSSPYHHQANSIAEKSVGTSKSLWKKAIESKHCQDTALWMYRITPLDDQLPSQLLYGRKPRSLLPSSKFALQSKHPDNNEHQEANLRKQTKQTDYYHRRAGCDKQALNTSEPVYTWNSQKHIWEPGKISSQPNPDREPRAYIVEKNGTLFQRTREHLRPRGTNKGQHTQRKECHSSTAFSHVLPKSVLDSPIPAGPPATALTNADSNPDPVNPDLQAEVTLITPSPIKDSTPVDPVPLKKPSGNPLQQRSGTEVIILKGGKLSYQPKNQVTRSGLMTQVPVKFKVSYYVGSDIY